MLSRGGAARALIAAGKYSARLGSYEHSVMSLSPKLDEPEARALAAAEGVKVVQAETLEEMRQAITTTDIVQVNWWNDPELIAFLRENLPECRLVTWAHVGGHTPPQILSREIVAFSDFIVACSPHTFEAPSIRQLSEDDRLRRAGMAYGACDFARLQGITPKAHATFNVGYIGTVHFLKMHRRYVEMSSKVNIPNVRFIVCGTGGAEDTLRREASALGCADRFEIRGYVEDIRDAISTFDVYGYPLCEDTYAASEVNLQEVMYAGVPPVVFPYGGVSKLVVNDFTGLIVHSEREYREAIEFLFRNPDERLRLGENAKRYASQIFGAENSARKLNEIYAKAMASPKRAHYWGLEPARPWSGSLPKVRGSALFIESMGDFGGSFKVSLEGTDLKEILEAEDKISNGSELLRSGGVVPYARYYKDDPHLALWAGLMEGGPGGNPYNAVQHLVDSLSLGIQHPRVLIYLARTAFACGETQLGNSMMEQVKTLAADLLPMFDSALKFSGESAR